MNTGQAFVPSLWDFSELQLRFEPYSKLFKRGDVKDYIKGLLRGILGV